MNSVHIAAMSFFPIPNIFGSYTVNSFFFPRLAKKNCPKINLTIEFQLTFGKMKFKALKSFFFPNFIEFFSAQKNPADVLQK